MIFDPVFINFETLGRIEIGRFVFLSALSPDLNRGFTLASFHEQRNPPVIKLLFTIYNILGSKTLTDNFRILGPLLSKPVDYLHLNLIKINFRTKVRFVNEMFNSVAVGTF